MSIVTGVLLFSASQPALQALTERHETQKLKPFHDDQPRRAIQIALLQTIRAAIETSTEPIHLKKEPKTWKDAVRNLYSFSDEGRLKPKI
ncbi:hypothetical protein CFAM422_012473 [Trichoderma lentiforme]|uniref:Uncharacterized protein n=1 Tax=Trichoderma lentiforme TaxID=1567552 RepID=A0A9P4X495_9HYPO|nr:hypothetical protein CFAM422_012473 [Trichoderma lentiforme]